MLSCCNDLVWGKNKFYFWWGRLFPGRAEWQVMFTSEEHGWAWDPKITRCLLAIIPRAAGTQDVCYLPKTRDSFYLCNYKPRGKANNASMASSLKIPFASPQGSTCCSEKFSSPSHLACNLRNHEPTTKVQQMCLLLRAMLVTVGYNQQIPEKLQSWWLW